MTLISHRGFAARSGPRASGLQTTLRALGLPRPVLVDDDQTEIGTWGLPEWHRDHEALLLASSVRRHDHDLSATEVRKLMQDDPEALVQVLPTFAAAVSTPFGPTSVATDYLGFRHVFHGQGTGTAVVSTSSHVCANQLGSGLDLEAVAVQSSLGWQLGQRSLFEGVSKLPPGDVATLEDGAVTLSSFARSADSEQLEITRAVHVAADFLRNHLTAYLEDHPDAGLQLTGGQDSRLLLSAIPRSLRRGLRVVTLGTAGDADVDIAADLATRYGMRHELLTLTGLEEVNPADAYALCLDAARRLDYSADPLAHAALTYAEARSEPGPRISGLGGEVARGFYYLGPPTTAPVSPQRARRLARWRMFVNEAVPVDALDASFARWAQDFATQEVVRALTETGRPWMAATDELYLGHRMQRWGGVTETAVCLDRDVVNPMLDERFISMVTALDPLDKRNSRFLSRLQLKLDVELGSIPLDGRPPPAAYAHRSIRNSAGQAATTLGKARRKAIQRLRRVNRPPAGGEILAAKVVAHWRDNPLALEGLAGLGILHEGWLENLVTGQATAPSSAVALMVNLIAATQAPGGPSSELTPGGGRQGKARG